MNKNLKITTSEFTCMLIGYSLVATQLKFPAVMNSYSAQNAWFTTLLGGIYPILFFTMYGFVYRAYPDKNIFEINRLFLGKFFGNLFNLLLVIYLVSYSITQFVGFGMMLTNTVLWYYSVYQTMFLIIITAALATFFSFKSLLKFGQISLYLVAFVLFIIAFALKDGSFSNIRPFLDAEPLNLLRATFHGIYAYAGFEVMLLYLPYLENKKDYKKIALNTCFAITFLLTWLVFIVIFYYGPDATSMLYFPLLNLVSSLKLPLVNNFIIIFVTLWSLHSLKNSTFSISYMLDMLPPKTNSKFKKLWLIILIPFLLFMIYKINNIINLVYFINYIFIYITLIILFNIFLLFIGVLRRNHYAKQKH